MKSIVLTAGTEHVLFGELAHLIADALWPDAGPNDDRFKYGAARVNLDGELAGAVKSGALPVKDPLTLGPHTFPIGDALNRALVTTDDLREFVAGRSVSVVVTPEPQAGPVLPAGASIDVLPIKSRRNALKPVIELAQSQSRNPKDTAEVWACLLVLAEQKSAPLIGATEEGLQYLKNGTVEHLSYDSLSKRIAR